MALTGAQYQSMRLKFRGLIASPFAGVSEAELNSFFKQLLQDAQGSAALPANIQTSCDNACAGYLKSADYTPTASDVPLFFAQVSSVPPNTPALVVARYVQLQNQFIGALSLAGVRTLAGLLSYFSTAYAGFVSAQTNWFHDTTQMTLAGAAPNQYYVKDPAADVVIGLSGAITSLTVEAVPVVVNSALNAGNSVEVWTSNAADGSGMIFTQSLNFNGTPGIKQQLVATVPVGTLFVQLIEAAYITGVSATAFTVVLKPATVSRRLVGYGDSILVFNNAVPISAGYMLAGARFSSRFDGVIPFGVSGASIFGDTANGTDFNTIAGQIVARCADGSLERVVYIEKGTNDYGNATCSAATFQTIYAGVVDAIHALDPTIKILCGAIWHRATLASGASVAEGANGQGSTLAQYDTAIQNVVSTRGSFCTFMDALSAFTLAQITAVGGLHPDTNLHGQVATWWLSRIDNSVTPNMVQIMGINLRAWFRGKIGLTPTQWVDQSGRGLHMTGTCTVLANALAGKNGAKLVAASSHNLQRSSIGTMAPPGTAPIVIGGVVRQDSWANNTGRIMGVTPFTEYQVIANGSTPQLKQFTNPTFGPANSGAPLATFVKIETGFTNSASDYLSCGPTASVTTVNGVSQGNTGSASALVLGTGNGTFCDETVCEFYWLDAVPTVPQVTAINAYMNAEYGI